jgi:hypothetical protein
VKGHQKSQWFKNNPEKASGWWKVMHDKVESALQSIEVALTSIGSVRKTAVDITALQTEKGNALSVFQDKNVWICDMGASKHVTKNL